MHITVKLVDTDRLTDRPTDIVSHRVAIAASNIRIPLRALGAGKILNVTLQTHAGIFVCSCQWGDKQTRQAWADRERGPPLERGGILKVFATKSFSTIIICFRYKILQQMFS